MSPGTRNVALTAHVVSSVGWLGSVAAFLALAVAGLRSDDPATVRAVYRAADLVTWFVIVPLSGAALLTGLIQSLGTPWGLFRHYWVLAKLLITVLATAILLLHTQAISHMSRMAADNDLASTDLRRLRIQLVADAAAAVIALIVATVLSVHKPRGVTPYGWRKQQEESRSLSSERPSSP